MQKAPNLLMVFIDSIPYLAHDFHTRTDYTGRGGRHTTEIDFTIVARSDVGFEIESRIQNLVFYDGKTYVEFDDVILSTYEASLEPGGNVTSSIEGIALGSLWKTAS